MKRRLLAFGLGALLIASGNLVGNQLASASGSAKHKVDKTPIIMGNNSTPDQGYLPMEMALASLKKQGYNVKKQVTFDSATLDLQALATDQIQLTSSPIVQVASAVGAGNVPIKVIATRGNNDWSLIATKSIKTCQQLNGQKVGIFSTGGVSTAYLYIYLKGKKCKGVKPDYVIIPDSGLRRQALAAGQIAASPLEPQDTIELLAAEPGKFHVMADFATADKGIGRDVIVTNQGMLRDHPSVIRAFDKAVVQAVRTLYKSKPYQIAKLDRKYLGLTTQVNAIAKYATKHRAWCANGGLNDGAIAHELKVFGNQYHFTPTNVTAGGLVSKGPMNWALKHLGKSKATAC